MSNRRGKSNPGGSDRYAKVGGGAVGSPLSYQDVPSELLAQAVEVVCLAGDAIVFGKTSDGGAASVRVLSGGQTHKWYPADRSELQALLEELAAVE